jgi:hypothetical protein
MGKSAHPDVLDGSLNIVKNNATRMTVCDGEPTTYTEANATFSLGSVTIDSSDFTLAAGDVSGRKATVAAQSVPLTADGEANHVALLDVANSKLLWVTTSTPRDVLSGGTLDVPAWDIENPQPV